MDITIHPKKLNGTIPAIPSKSQAHRILICAAFSDGPTQIICSAVNEDIEATADCLRALGAIISRTADGYYVKPVTLLPEKAVLNCRESGSTLRFLLPIVGALGVDTTFVLGGRLPNRPLSPLWEEMERMGCRLCRPTDTTIHCSGKLNSGKYTISGSVSSQFISGLLFALTLIPGKSRLIITDPIESRPYIEMTQRVLALFGVVTDDYMLSNSHLLKSPGKITVEGDWSNAAFFLTAQALGSKVCVSGLDLSSPQGDKAVLDILPQLNAFTEISAQDIPDLVPILAVAAAANYGAKFSAISRLRLKESDRIATVCEMLQNFGIEATADECSLIVHCGAFHGCVIDSHNDHRIAMAAAIAATIAAGPVTILGAECVSKSYPSFWEEYKSAGGQYEQYIR